MKTSRQYDATWGPLITHLSAGMRLPFSYRRQSARSSWLRTSFPSLSLHVPTRSLWLSASLTIHCTFVSGLDHFLVRSNRTYVFALQRVVGATTCFYKAPVFVDGGEDHVPVFPIRCAFGMKRAYIRERYRQSIRSGRLVLLHCVKKR